MSRLDEGTIVFSASDGDSGWELWKSDGTVAGTCRVKDIRVGPGDSFPFFLTSNGEVSVLAKETIQ